MQSLFSISLIYFASLLVLVCRRTSMMLLSSASSVCDIVVFNYVNQIALELWDFVTSCDFKSDRVEATKN